jgi:hypothetical protein
MSNSEPKKIVVFDIDGTLANAQHRIHHVKPEPGQKKNWSAFFKEAANDEPYYHMLPLTKLYRDNDYLIVLCTGRPTSFRQDTVAWLNKYDIPWDTLLMRLTIDNGKDYEIKPKLLTSYFEVNNLDLKSIEAIYEDRLTVCEAWKQMGLPVMVCGDEWRNPVAKV